MYNDFQKMCSCTLALHQRS